jgi:hypothetical protein
MNAVIIICGVGIEFSTQHLLSKRSITLAMLPDLFFFLRQGLAMLPRLTSDYVVQAGLKPWPETCDPPDLASQMLG